MLCVFMCMCECSCVCECVCVIVYVCACVYFYATRSHCSAFISAAQETFSHSKAVRNVIRTLTNHSLIL